MADRDPHSVLASTIRMAREARGWSQDQLGEAVGLTRSTIARLELGDRSPSFETLVDIARVLDLDLGFLTVTP